jgi:F0F1-type ATP synthase delta subunit
MSLAANYAALLSGGADMKKTLAYMKSRGHLSLLPQIVRILERRSAEGGSVVVTVAKESDAKKFSSKIAEALKTLGADMKTARTVVDERAVGGYAVRTPSALVDRSFRTALITIYKQAVGK